MDKSRTELLLGFRATERLSLAHVAVFGVGGVGGFAVEALARAGVGRFTLVDSDVVSTSNVNRQIIALQSTVGRAKVDVMRERILDINPEAEVSVFRLFYSEQTRDTFDFSSFDYVVDAIDSVKSKVDLIVTAKAAGAPIISAMGAGRKLDPTRFEVGDISRTSVCPLARAVRCELKKRDIESLKVVYSRENPVMPPADAPLGEENERVPGSVSFVPSVMGLIIGGEVVKDLAKTENK